MTGSDTAFAGSIPALYDHYLGPFLFEPYAAEVARRAAALHPSRILETAAGTGIVTDALAKACPAATIVATDLNAAMLDVAAQRVASDRVTLQPADALSLPFEDESFDLVVCQFGVMFFPDRVRGNREAHRVLRPDGRYLMVIWDRLANNPASQIIHDSIAALFPDNPPGFLARTPFGYSDLGLIEHDLLAAGFTDIELETVTLRSLPGTTAESAATGMVQGSPLRTEVEANGTGALQRATEAARLALKRLSGPAGFDSRLSAHVVTAIK